MAFKYFSKIFIFALLGLLVLNSCTKEDSVTIIETEEDLDLQFRMVINGIETETNAFAAYCENDTMTFLSISNKVELLGFTTSILDYEDGDFVFYTGTYHDTTSWSYGGRALGEDITGLPGLSILFSDATINIESNDGDIAVGSSEGTLIGIDQEGNFSMYPYAIDFAAEIIQVSTFCD